MKPTDFKVGEIYKMKVASRSHVKKPYYVQIIEVGDDFIKTNIPNKHSLKICKGNGNWEYQTERMEKVGTIKTHLNLLFNQDL